MQVMVSTMANSTSAAAEAKELLRTAVREDADSRDLDAVLAFVDTDTLPDRLKDR